MRPNFDFLFENLPEGIVIQDYSGRIIQANKRAEELLGLSQDQLMGRVSADPEWRAVQADGSDFPGEEHPAMVTLATGKVIEGVIMGVFNPKLNNWVWLEVSSFPQFGDDSNMPELAYAIFRDVTAKRQAEQTVMQQAHILYEKSQLLESLINSQSSYLVRADLEGNYVYVNTTYERVFGWIYPNGMIGNSIMESVLPYEYVKLNDVVEACLASPGTFHTVSIDKPAQNGEILNTIWEFTTFDNEDGEILGVQCFGMDITAFTKAQKELKLLEEKYRSLIDGADIFNIIIDSTGRIEYANKKVLDILHVSEADLLENNLNLKSLYADPEQLRLFDKDLAELFETGTSYSKEIQLKLGENLVWVKGTATPVFNERKEVISAHVSAIDITENKLTELKLRLSEDNYKSLFNDSPQAILVLKGGVFVDCNLAAAMLYKGSKKDLIGLSPNDISPNKQLDGRMTDDLIVGYLDKVEKDRVVSFEWMHLTKFGERFMVEIKLYKSTYFGEDAILVFWKDLTKLKDSQRKADQLLQIIDQSPVSIIMTDVKGNIEFVNRAVETNLGYSVQELIGKNPRIWKSDKLPEVYFKEFWESILRGDIWRGEFENIHKDGSRVIESSTAFAIFDDNGNMTNLAAIQENITDRKRTEDELKLFRDIFENSVTGQVVIQDNHVVYCNEYFAKMLGWQPEDIRSQTFNSFLSAQSVGTHGMILKRLENSADSSKAEFELIAKNGQSIPVLVHFNNLRENTDQSNYIALSVIDISERKRIENEILQLNLSLEEKVRSRTQALALANNQLNSFFESSLDLLCIANQNGYFVKLSNSFKTILGYELEELLDQKFVEFIHPDDRNDTQEKMSELNAQQVVYKFVNRYRSKDGSYKDIEWYASPVGEYIYAVARDVSESLEQKRKLIEAREQAEYANAQKSKFLSRMSHELRTPMNSILGFAQLLEISEMNQMQESAVNHILKSGKHLLELINEVLEITRIENGNISLSIEPVNITALSKEVIQLLMPLARENAVDVIADHTLDTDFYVRADQQRSKQIITNLVSNGIKYNVVGGRVELSQSRWLSDDSKTKLVRLTISDTGVGIDESEITKLFEPFQRIHAENSTIEGTGLGLSVVKEFVEVLGGKVGLESKKGKGSVFWIDLPECETTMEQVFSQIKGSSEFEERNAPRQTHQILYIEDNPSNITLLKEIFTIKRETFGLRIATTGRDGLNELRTNKPDLVLLDLDLPDMHGSEIMEIIRSNEQSKHLPVIVVSADATLEKIDKLFQLGADDYITKPFDVNELLSVMDKHLQ